MRKYLGLALGLVVVSGVEANASPAERLQAQMPGDSLGSITSVSQLSDVQSTDWAFTALQSLVERYNCIVGYPDMTYRGRQTLTRYEFAAGLNACFDRINELIGKGLSDKVSRDDLLTIQRLQDEFSEELRLLRGRIRDLEGRVDTLADQQFSTTTKLSGSAILGISTASDSNTVMAARSRLQLNTSFTGSDLLVTRLESGNNSGNPTPFLAYSANAPEVRLSTLRYDFRSGKDFQGTVGVMEARDWVDRNSFANDEAMDFSNRFFLNNQLILPIESGAGAFGQYRPGGGPFYVSGLYYGDRASVAGGTGGLFGENNQVTVELGYVNAPFGLRFQYTRATLDGLTGYSSLLGVPSSLDAFGMNWEWTVAQGLGLFGRLGIGTVRANAVPNVTADGVSWMTGFAFPDLFRRGALAGIAVGQPVANVPVPQTNLELFYNYPVNNNIRISPDLQFIFNNGNMAGTPVFVGTLRTVFSF